VIGREWTERHNLDLSDGPHELESRRKCEGATKIQDSGAPQVSPASPEGDGYCSLKTKWTAI